MKNIWLINNYSYPPGTSNWRRHYDLCKELVKKNYKIEIIGGSFVHDRKKQILQKKEKFRIETYNKINYHILKGISYQGNIKRILSMIEFMVRVFFYTKKISNKPDLIYCSCPHPFNGLISVYLAKKYKVPLILEIRDIWPDTWVALGAIKEKSVIYKIFSYIEKFLYDKADIIIDLMPGIDAIANKGIEKNKIKWLSNGVNLEEFDNDYLKEPKYKFDSKKINVTYTGSIGIANALQSIFEIAKSLEKEDIVFNLIGDGPLKKEYEEICIKNEIKNVSFYSQVLKNEVPALLKESDILIALSKKTELDKYGVSLNKIFEYLAAKKPILIAYDTEYDIIKEANCGISISAENNEKIKEGLLKLKRLCEVDREKLGENGRKYVEENFTTEILGERLYLIIKELLERN